MRLEIFGDIHACSEMSFICHMAYNSLCQINGFFIFILRTSVKKVYAAINRSNGL